MRRHAATTAPMARCIFNPQPPFEPMTDREEPVMTRIQTEWMATVKMSHTSQLEMATANESVNPMAPAKPKPCIKKSIPCVSDRDDWSELEPVCNILQYLDKY